MALTVMFITITLLSMMVVDSCPVVISLNGSCCEVKRSKNEFKFSSSLKSNMYNITNFCGGCELVAEGYCDAVTDGGGWLVIQRRKDGSVDFNRSWVDYEDGFGKLTGEFWYGLRAIHCLTNQGQWELRIDYIFPNGTNGYLSYSNFRVGPATEQYPLTISGYSGVTTDPFSKPQLNRMKFTTRDKDNDRWSSGNCAGYYEGNGFIGGWWHRNCCHIRPNHGYNNKYTIYLNRKWYSLPFIEIKIRPKNCNSI